MIYPIQYGWTTKESDPADDAMLPTFDSAVQQAEQRNDGREDMTIYVYSYILDTDKDELMELRRVPVEIKAGNGEHDRHCAFESRQARFV